MNKDKHIPPTYSSNQGKKDENSPKSKDVEYDWGKNPNSLKALKKHQYPKGVSGNIMGRKPTFEALSKALKKIGDEDVLSWSDEPKGYTYKEGVLKRIWTDALKGDIKYVQLLAQLGCLD